MAILGLLGLGCTFGTLRGDPAASAAPAVYSPTVFRSAQADVDATCKALSAAIEAQGLVCQGIRNLTQAMAKHGVQHDGEVRIVEFCKATYAHEMLTHNPEVSAFMPCIFGVFTGLDGQVYISIKNQAAMATMCEDPVLRLVTGAIAKDQAAILAAVSAQPAVPVPVPCVATEQR